MYGVVIIVARLSLAQTLKHNEMSCELGHTWLPDIDPFLPPSQWVWICRSCEATSSKPPPGLKPSMSLPELEAMIDSSLRVADKVEIDNQSIKGEKWWFRNSIWRYTPYLFQSVYHVCGGQPFVMCFRYEDETIPDQFRASESIRDTETYQKILVRADMARLARLKSGL